MCFCSLEQLAYLITTRFVCQALFSSFSIFFLVLFFFFQTTFLSYHNSFSLSSTFFKFFRLFQVVMLFLFPRNSFIILPQLSLFVNNIFYFFQFFLLLNGEGGIWTLAPLLTTYSLSRGAPSATWVFLHMVNYQIYAESLNQEVLAERVGFEPTVPCGITGFQDQLHKPLGHHSA